MKIEWNKVTWYSKAIAVLVFLLTFFIAFKLGMLAEANRLGVPYGDDFRGGMMHGWDGNGDNGGWGMMGWWGTEEGTQRATSTPATGAPVVGAGAHCGGNIKDAPVCATGYHCQLTVSMPDVGGTCVAD